MSGFMTVVLGWFDWLKSESVARSTKEDVDDVVVAPTAAADKKGKGKAVAETPAVPPNSTERECLNRLIDMGFNREEVSLFNEVCRSNEDIERKPAALEILFNVAKRLRLPLERLQTDSKQDWFSQLTKYDYVTAYYIKMGLFSHWKLILVTDTDVIIQIELKAYAFTDKLAQYFQHSIRQLNSEPVEDLDKIIIPCLTMNNAVSDEELKLIRRLSKRVPFAEVFGAAMLDREAFKKYDYFRNNCQHYIKRIYNGVILPYITDDDAEMFQRTIVAQREALLRDQPRETAGSSVAESLPPDGPQNFRVEAWE